MKRPESARPKPAHVVWDEPNLQANEKIKEQFSNVKVDEPKTPYHTPLTDAHMDADEDMEHLSLDSLSGSGDYSGRVAVATAEAAAAAAEEAEAAEAEAAAADVVVEATAAATTMTAGGDHQPGGGGGGDIVAMEVDQHAADGEGPRRKCGWSSDGGGHPEKDFEEDEHPSGSHKTNFAESRKAHYHMGEALRLAKELLNKGEDEEEEEEEGGGAGPAAPPVAVASGMLD